MNSIKNLTIKNIKYPIASKYDGEDNDIVETYATKIELNTEIEARKAVDGQTGQTYLANDATNYISKATDLNDADVTLDSALKTESDRAILQEDIIESAIGLATDGTHISTTGNYTNNATTITEEISAIDTALKSEADRAIKWENILESSIGLSDDGSHIATTGNYTSTAVTITGEISALDTQLKTTTDDLAAEINRATSQENTLEASIGLSETGTHVTTSGNYTNGATTITGEIAAIDSALKIESGRAINQEDTIESAIGLAKDGTHVTTSGNYTSKATTVTGEISALDTQVKLNADAIDMLNGEDEGSVKKALKDAKDYTDTEIQKLDVDEIGGTGKVVTTISETDGKISATTIDLVSTTVARTATEATDTKVAVDGTNVEKAIESLATSVKTVKDNAAKYSVKKVTDNLANNVREAYQLVETVEGVSKDIDVQIPIYKDSSLKSVALSDTNESGTSGQFLVLTYILDTGEESVQYLDVSKFLVESEFKDGLQVNSKGEVSVLIDPDSEFISVSDKGIKVSGISDIPSTTEKVTVSKEITVEGGPLADLYKNSLGKNTIAADITMQKLLEILFTKEIWPTNITFTEGVLSTSIVAPSFSANSTLVEVGTTVTVSACTPTATSYNTSARKLSGLTYGYSTDNTTKNSNTSISVAATNIVLNGDYTITRTVLGNIETKTGTISEVALAETSFTANEGSNTVKIAITGAAASCSFASIDSVWYYSNLGNIENTHKTSTYAEVTKTTSAPTNSKSITVTGVYPVYATKSSISSLDKLALQTSTIYEISMPVETSSEKQSFAIYNGKSIKSIQRFDTVANTYQDYSLSDFVASTVSYTIGANNTVTYIKYTRNAGTNGATKFKIILS